MMQQMRKGWAVTIAVALVGQAGLPLMAVDRDSGSNDRNTTSPIKHVIVLASPDASLRTSTGRGRASRASRG
jgi:hypothetical protein